VKGFVRSAQQVPSRPVERGVQAFIQVLVGPEDGAPHYITRKFTLLPGGRIPRHKHPGVEHEQFLVAGRLRIGIGEEVFEAKAGEAIYIPADTPHWYENPGLETAEFICVIPKTASYSTEWLEE